MDMTMKELKAVERESGEPLEHRRGERRRSEEERARERRLEMEKECHLKTGRGDGEQSAIAIAKAQCHVEGLWFDFWIFFA